jgi:CheY-like chemotaxis protein
MSAAKIILLVEDNEAAREGLASVLRREGYEVPIAADGQQALDLLTSGPDPDLIILDLVLPVLDGWQVLRRLREELHSAVPVLITTGTMLPPPWAERHECEGFLRKPIDTGFLLEEVCRCLSGKGPMPSSNSRRSRSLSS